MNSKTKTKRIKKPPMTRIVILPVEKVADDDDNENFHPESQKVLLQASVRLYGQVEAILVDEKPMPDGRHKVLDGHGIKDAMIAEGYTHVRCELSTLAGAKRAAYRIATNQLGRLSHFDMKLLPLNVEAIVKMAKKEKLDLNHEWLGFEPDEWNHIRGGDNWQTRLLDPNAIDAHDENADTFVIKVAGVIRKDRNRILKKVSTALKGTKYAAEAY